MESAVIVYNHKMRMETSSAFNCILIVYNLGVFIVIDAFVFFNSFFGKKAVFSVSSDNFIGLSK